MLDVDSACAIKDSVFWYDEFSSSASYQLVKIGNLYQREREEGGHTRASIMRLKWYGWRLARWVVSYNASAMGCRGGLP